MKISLPINRPPRILVTRTDRIGDFILSTPVFSELRKAYPNAFIAGLTFLENRELVEGNPYLNEVILYDKKGSEKSWWGHFLFSRKIRQKNFDIAIHLHATNRMHSLTWLARVPYRIGWTRRMPWALTHAYDYEKKEGKKHEAEYNFRLFEELGVPAPAHFETFFPLSERSVLSLHERMNQKSIPQSSPYVVINPGASDEGKIWNIKNFAESMDLIHENYDVTFVVIGSREDKVYAASLREETKVPFFDLSGQLTLGMLGALLKASTLLLSNDSGPVHMAQALRTPVISIFMHNDLGRSIDRWKPLYENSRALFHRDIHPRDVLKAFEDLSQLKKRGAM